MARFLDDKVRCDEAAMYWTRACCKQKTAMGGGRGCCHEYCLSGDRLRLREGVCNNAVECLNRLLHQCDTSTIKTGTQPHSRVLPLIPTPVLTLNRRTNRARRRALVGWKQALRTRSRPLTRGY
jgi:hypothetical protein